MKNITAWYRQKLDAVIARRPELSRTSDGVSTFSFTPDPDKSFQRGRTDYFVHGRRFDKPYELAQLESPKNTGSPVGRCERVEPGEIFVRPLKGVSIANGDGLTYLGDDEEIHGLAVNRAESEGGLVKLLLRSRREVPEGLRRGHDAHAQPRPHLRSFAFGRIRRAPHPDRHDLPRRGRRAHAHRDRRT